VEESEGGDGEGHAGWDECTEEGGAVQEAVRHHSLTHSLTQCLTHTHTPSLGHGYEGVVFCTLPAG
jgi:hypothetical protein